MCMTRPACLDQTPACMIAEPSSGWCEDGELTGLQRAQQVLQGFVSRIQRLQQFWTDMETQAQSIQDDSRRTQLLAVIHRHQDKLNQILSQLTSVKQVILDRIQTKMTSQGVSALWWRFGMGQISQIPDVTVFSDPLRMEESDAVAFQNQNQMISNVVITATADEGGVSLIMLAALAFLVFGMRGRRY